jgi:heptosyltransferase-2
VDVVVTQAGANVLANNPMIRQIVVYEKRDSDRGLAGFARLARRLRREQYDIAYLAQGSVRSAALALSAGIRHRVGFDTSAGRALYTERVRYRPDVHHAERLWSLAHSDCADPPTVDQITPRLFPGDVEKNAVAALLGEGKIGDGFVALAPGSAWGTKRWPFYPELAANLAQNFQIVVIGGRDDETAGNMILAHLPPGRGLNAAGRLSLLASAEMIDRAAALVTNDSAPQHFASAMHTPTVTIFGPTSAAFGFGPLAPRSESVGLTDLACRPCHRHGPARCPLGHWRCMRELSSEQVHEVLFRILSNSEQS